MSNSIGLARVQKVFAVIETVRGTAVWPAAADFVVPSGDAVMNQVPDFVDSEEKTDSLDVLAQFANAKPPVDWTLPTYVRAVALGTAPQAAALFKSMQGKAGSATAAAVNTGGINNAVTSVPYKTALVGDWPASGVIRIGTEDIYYAAINTSTKNFTGCVRGYGGSTAASALEDAAITLKSICYLQQTTSPSFTLYVQTDHLVQRATGCAVSQGTLGIDNEGAVTLNFQGQGMAMGWAGTCTLAAEAASGQQDIVVPNSALYTVGMRIHNVTKADHATDGYTIDSINHATNTLNVNTNLVATWAIGDVVAGYLPAGTPLGTVIESRNTDITIDSVAGKFKSTDLTFNVPKQYLTDEVGTDYPEDYLEQPRSIESDMKIYFRQADAQYLKTGFDGEEVPIEVTFGDTGGKKMVVFLKRCKLKVPTINFAAPAVELSMPFKALGTVGEDSAVIRFE